MSAEDVTFSVDNKKEVLKIFQAELQLVNQELPTGLCKYCMLTRTCKYDMLTRSYPQDYVGTAC
jgi:hypothetical protein